MDTQTPEESSTEPTDVCIEDEYDIYGRSMQWIKVGLFLLAVCIFMGIVSIGLILWLF